MFRAFAAVLLLLVAAAAIFWVARVPIADATLRRALASRGVVASYDVKSIGLRWERIENLRIGDPGAPDLTAEWAEVRLQLGLNGLRATAVRAGGVRLRGRIVNGRVQFGQLDRLLPQGDATTPFELPDLDIDVSDARARIDSPWGPIGARIDGKGNLANGFSGKMAAIAPVLKVAQCDAQRVTAYVDLTVVNRAPRLIGPVRADALHCAEVVAAAPALALDVALSAALDRWRGTAAVEARGLRFRDTTLAALTGRLSFDGTPSDTRASGDVRASAGRRGATRIAGLRVKGAMSTANGARGQTTIEIARLMPDPAIVRQLAAATQGATGTPVGPVLAQIETSVRGAAAGVAISADAAFEAGRTTIAALTATGANGAALRMGGGSGLVFGANGIVADTVLTLSGGGFPKAQAIVRRRADGMTVGIVQIDPFARGTARMALDRVRFAVNPAGVTRIETVAVVDGPLAGGSIRGLRMPINATIAPNGNLLINNGCTPLRFQALAVAGLTLQPASLRLCPVDGNALMRRTSGRLSGGVLVAAPRLEGRVGSTPLLLSATHARVLLGAPGFTVEQLSARLGSRDRLSVLSIGALDGRFAGTMLRGRFEKTSGEIGAVPLRVDDAAGDWALRNGTLTLGGRLRLSDAFVPGRFNPLISEDATLRMTDGRIEARATLRAPVTGTKVVDVAIAHNLGAGRGTASLVVDDLRFDKTVQPEQLTRLTLGVIANVEGSVSGRGDIAWNAAGVRSTGRFASDGLDFAAAFGPVTGLKGTVQFDDLLALSTPPGQQATIATVNPGTPVTDGVIVYQLLAGQRIAIERGTWPFAGGDLLLDPTTLDMGQDNERKLVFRVVGLDAAKFIERLEFENLAATGIFDGVMPMYFNASGGRIEGGRLVVRRGGGTLAYVGEVSNADMNIYAKLAFDALKSIRYNNLTIALNGPLDGEIVSQINFDGINEAPLSPPRSFIARQFIGLPFVFNIKVTAPFRGLLNTAKTFQDPSSLLQRTVPELRAPTVQPSESERKP